MLLLRLRRRVLGKAACEKSRSISNSFLIQKGVERQGVSSLAGLIRMEAEPPVVHDAVDSGSTGCAVFWGGEGG